MIASESEKPMGTVPQMKASQVYVAPDFTVLLSKKGEVHVLHEASPVPKLMHMGGLRVTQVACGLLNTCLLTSEVGLCTEPSFA